MNRFLVYTVAPVIAFTLCPRVSAQPDCPPEGTYELLDGSELRIDCFVCELVENVIPLVGRFRLEELHLGQVGDEPVYALRDIEFRHRKGKTSYHRVTGGGTYAIAAGGAQTIALALSLRGQEPQNLAGAGAIDPAVVWPSIDIEATVDQPGQGIFIQSVRLVAAPVRPAKFTQYRLLPESYWLVDCDFCRRLVLPIPIEGNFLLGQVQDTPPFSFYRMECIDFRATGVGPPPAVISGFGSYTRFEEVALLETMTLDLGVDQWGEGFKGAVLQSEMKSRGAPFPAIRIDLVQSNPVDSNTIYKIHIVAEPFDGLPPVEFRRGDANDDGRVDLSDPVAILNWQFLGEVEPGCRETADANDDGASDLSDPVYLLNYLFLGGEEPAKPGAAACGPGPGFGVECAKYDSCVPGK